nr:MAG TPA: hypothetical protein [Caudoviricetes sp.]
MFCLGHLLLFSHIWSILTVLFLLPIISNIFANLFVSRADNSNFSVSIFIKRFSRF